MLRNISIPIHNFSEVIIYHLTSLEFLALNPQFDFLSIAVGLIKHLLFDLNALIKKSLLLSSPHTR